MSKKHGKILALYVARSLSESKVWAIYIVLLEFSKEDYICISRNSTCIFRMLKVKLGKDGNCAFAISETKLKTGFTV